jgi:hypothetical protein
MANSGIKVEVGDSIINDHETATASVGVYIDGNKVVGTQESAIADITPDADGTSAGTAVNGILAVLRAHGLIAT